MSFINPFEPGFYKEKSILNVKDVIEWKRKNNLYNFDTLPKVAVISMVNKLSLPKRLIKDSLSPSLPQALIVDP